MCTQSCRTFLWGGRGSPRYDEEGRCFCVCEDDRWSDLNLLARPSCVPVKAHVIYGWVGLVLSVAALCHAAYQLHRQLRFHAQLLAPWTTCAEQCRRSLHVISVIVAVLSLLYFITVLEDELQWSVFVLAITQFPVNISCAFYATRMWIYAIDPRLMRGSPEVLGICSRMEKPPWRRAAFGAMSIAPAVGLIFDIAGLTHYAMRAVAAGILCMAVIISVSFWVGGRSLVNAINDSLRQHCQQRQEAATVLTAATAATGGTGGDADENEQDGGGGGIAAVGGLVPGAGDGALLAAKKKITRMMIFVVQNVVMVVCMLLITICTGYAVAAPLPIFLVPIVFVPLVWDIVNVQLHAGRSKIRSGSRRGLFASAITGRYRRSSQLLGRTLSRRVSSVYLAFNGAGNQQVVPTEQPSEPARPAE